METETKKTPRGAAASILAAAALWGIIGVWNRRLMAGASPRTPSWWCATAAGWCC